MNILKNARAVEDLFIESALSISAELLMGLQSDYTMQHTRNDAEVKRKMRSVRPYSSPAAPAIISR